MRTTASKEKNSCAISNGGVYIVGEAYFDWKRSRMDALVETSSEPRKEWVTPELKKIDIDAITAIGPTNGLDSQVGT